MSKTYDYCIATHPNMPNTSTNSRGRKYHITLDAGKTLCNLVVTQLIGSKEDVFDETGMRKGNLVWSPTQHRQGMCGSCRLTAKQKQLEVKDMGY